MIRRAEEKDIEIITEYNCKMALETEDLELDKNTVLNGVRRAILDESKAVYFVYQVEANVVAQLMLTKEWSDWRNGFFYWIQSVYVDKAYRRKGIFKQLYRHVEKLLEDNPDACGLRLYVENNNKRAKRTYESLGMYETHYNLYEIESKK